MKIIQNIAKICGCIFVYLLPMNSSALDLNGSDTSLTVTFTDMQPFIIDLDGGCLSCAEYFNIDIINNTGQVWTSLHFDLVQESIDEFAPTVMSNQQFGANDDAQVITEDIVNADMAWYLFSGSPFTSGIFDGYMEATEFDTTIGVYLNEQLIITPAAVPVPAAAWLFGSGLLGLVGIARRKKA